MRPPVRSGGQNNSPLRPNCDPRSPVRTSGQSHGPIRANHGPGRETILTHNPYSNSHQGSPTQRQIINRATASTSISGLDSPNINESSIVVQRRPTTEFNKKRPPPGPLIRLNLGKVRKVTTSGADLPSEAVATESSEDDMPLIRRGQQSSVKSSEGTIGKCVGSRLALYNRIK